jgi:hypothetical protein
MDRGQTSGLDVLAVWNDVDPAHEAEYHRWYWEQHLPERLSVPGFFSAYRYQAMEGNPKFFTWYFVRDVEVLRSPFYLERLANPTEWTQRVMPSFRNMTRCACRLTADVGRGIGGTTVVMRVSAEKHKREIVVRTMRDFLPKLLASFNQAEITRAQVWESDREISDQRTPEQALRGGADRMIDCAVVLHCPSIEIAHVLANRLSAAVSPIAGASVPDGPHIYTLLHSLSVVG